MANLAFSRRQLEYSPISTFPVSGAAQQLQAYWVGHSLMQETVTSASGDVSLFILMERFATEMGLGYGMFDHTLFGAPLSLQWRGSTHSYERLAPEMEQKRRSFPEKLKDFDSFVLTEVVPLASVYRLEYSAFYLQEYCRAIKAENPNARVYVYESWDYFHAGNNAAPIYCYDWISRMEAQTRLWEQLADTAARGAAVGPSLTDQVRYLLGGKKKPQVSSEDVIFSIPVGRVLLALLDRLKTPRRDDNFLLANGASLEFYQLFTNTYENVPTNWPLLPDEVPANIDNVVENLQLVDPEKPFDDIHPSAIGIYIVALTHFATLYRRSPVGLSTIDDISPEMTKTLQTIVWDVVTNTKRSGVKSS